MHTLTTAESQDPMKLCVRACVCTVYKQSLILFSYFFLDQYLSAIQSQIIYCPHPYRIAGEGCLVFNQILISIMILAPMIMETR